METSRIQDHALIGDGRSAALVSRAGEVDWLCWPRFDSPSLFAAVLDPEVGGTWRISPVGPAASRQRYVGDTNVVETRFRCPGGELCVTDAMMVDSEEAKRCRLVPQHELLRQVACARGEVEVDVHFDPRPDYGRARSRLTRTGAGDLRLEWKRHLFCLRSPVPLGERPGGAWGARLRLREGETLAFSLTWSSEAPAVLPPLGAHAAERLERSLAWWRSWAARATYAGPFRDEVVRSALALKLMVFAPSGAIIAAPTTSLPESPHGAMNWDYRFCWLRDAALTVRVLLSLGYHEEAEAFVSWMLHATRLSRPELNVLYDVYGERPRRERVLSHLRGHGDARPVRVGNAASGQLQLDVYGEVIDAATQLLRLGGTLDRGTQGMLRDFGEWVCRHWELPDAGLWEPRTPPLPHTHSRVLCWVALQRLLELEHRGLVRPHRRERFAYNVRLLQAEVEARGFNAELGSYTQVLGGDTVDASLLLLSWYGFARASSPRMQGTWRRVRERLSAGPGLLYRHEQSRLDGEGAFVFCSFWAAEFLARGGGSLAEAQALFASVLPYANEAGLLAEEVDPATGEALGNFPQAFSHVGLISAALALEERAREERAAGHEERRAPAASPSLVEASP